LIDLETRKIYYGPFLKDLEDPCGEKDIYECGSFLNHLLKEKIIKPENLWIIGTQDLDKVKQNTEPLYSEKMLSWVKRGMHVVSKEDLVLSGIPDEIEGQTYISFDMDLGSLASVFAARFLNYIGLNERQFLNLVHELSEKVKTKKIELIGLDIMEIDIHFLGAEINGNKDLTGEIASEIINRMIYSNIKN
jgi:arginase family enzyme